LIIWRCKLCIKSISNAYRLALTNYRYGQQDTIDSFLQHYVSDLITASDDLLKRTDADEIEINQLARERLSSLLQAIRLLRSCITAISREKKSALSSTRRTTTPRPDSLDPDLGETRRSGRASPSQSNTTPTSASVGIKTWQADLPIHVEAQPHHVEPSTPTTAFLPVGRSWHQSRA
jgi:hypothetical protein